MNGRAIFIADCHVSGKEPARVKSVSDFLQDSTGAQSLFILGDLFEAWAGPALLSDTALLPVFESLARLSKSGTEIYFLRGNRDFLFGEAEKKKLGLRYVGDSMAAEIGGQKIHLSHGDLFCAHDSHYQGYRRVIRSGPLRAAARVMPPALGRKIAESMRKRSEEIVRRKGPRMTALVPAKVIETLIETGADAAICGHVHRREELQIPVSGVKKTVYVLGSWERGKCALEYSSGGFRWIY